MHLQSLKLLRQTVYEMFFQENTVSSFDLDLAIKITQVVAQYPLHHVTYVHAKFEVATSNGLGGDSLHKKIH